MIPRNRASSGFGRGNLNRHHLGPRLEAVKDMMSGIPVRRNIRTWNSNDAGSFQIPGQLIDMEFTGQFIPAA